MVVPRRRGIILGGALLLVVTILLLVTQGDQQDKDRLGAGKDLKGARNIQTKKNIWTDGESGSSSVTTRVTRVLVQTSPNKNLMQITLNQR